MNFDTAYFNIGQLDHLAYRDSFAHRLDPRAKVLITLLFVVAVVSFPKYEVTGLAPFFLFPAVFIALGDLPPWLIVKKVMAVAPFAVLVGLFNPLLDRAAVPVLGAEVAAGWLSLLSILLKFFLTIGAALVLIATTSFPGVCGALRRFGAPALFVSQLLFLYRYLFVLLEETMRMVRARELRSFGKRGREAVVAARIIGSLFLRTVERAERIYRAMLSRGYAGDIPVLRRSGWRTVDSIVVATTAASFAVFRLVPVVERTGTFLQGLFK